MSDVKPGFYVTADDTICYIDENELEYHPNAGIDPGKAAAAGIQCVRCNDGIYYYHMTREQHALPTVLGANPSIRTLVLLALQIH